MFAFNCQRSRPLTVFTAVASLSVSFMVGVSPASASLHSRTIVDGYNLGLSNRSRVAVATREAGKLLGLAWFPPGSRKSTSWVYVNGHQYTEGVPTIGGPDVVDIAHYYVAGEKYQGLSWLDGHVPNGSTLDGRGGTNRGHLEWSYSFPTTSFMPYPDLQYTKLILPNGKVELRIDAQIQWTPQKSVYSIIGAGANRVTVAYVRVGSEPQPINRSVVTTDATTISTIRNQLNALPVAYPGIDNCPLETLGNITVKFYRAGQSNPFAVVSNDAGGCGEILISQYSKGGQRIGSGDDAGFTGVTPAVAMLLGVTNLELRGNLASSQ
jgi:hypothetical protein